MSFWNIMNWVAWGLCALLVYVIAVDFIKVEKERAAQGRQRNN